MKAKKEKSGSVKVDPKILTEAKDHCKSNGLIIGYYATEALREKLQKDKSELIK